MSDNWAATYRLQLHAGFTLDAAGRILPYLAELGITHVYLSPCLQATPGSMHGYDVTDPARISDDLGGEPAWSRFVDSARGNGLDILLDIVPNHMSATKFNRWWDDVLAHGPFSGFADHFDIKRGTNEAFRVHLCVLARAFGDALEAGELKVEIRQGRPWLNHFDNSWPLGPASWGELLGSGSTESRDACFAELERLLECAAPDDAERRRYAEHAARAAELLDAASGGEREPAGTRARVGDCAPRWRP